MMGIGVNYLKLGYSTCATKALATTSMTLQWRVPTLRLFPAVSGSVKAMLQLLLGIFSL